MLLISSSFLVGALYTASEVFGFCFRFVFFKSRFPFFLVMSENEENVLYICSTISVLAHYNRPIYSDISLLFIFIL
jgi:hypothetical protein